MTEETPIAQALEDRPLGDALSQRYLAYALSTITGRSLPDVRDGLKPVHRRLLFAMRFLRLGPDSPFRKSARVVGDVIGRFHPHGDQAVYDAMVRMAQDFAVRYPLVEGQGNFGNIDGDSAAAMRYTEARLTSVARLMMEGLDEDAVDFRPTYDGETDEPVVMPALFPNLLANGASGIAVGMATNIPPHNVAEVCEALETLIARPAIDDRDLASIVKGPDLPTGGLLIEDSETVAAVYEAGRGPLRVRARWHREDRGRGQWVLVITEIPYLVPKARLIERIATLMENRSLPLLADVIDESTDEVRVVLEPKSRSVEPEALMESLFRQTDLESRFSVNMTVLDPQGVPRVMPLKQILHAHVEHGLEVIRRRARHRLGKVENRLEILDGYLIVHANLDEVIRIIREAEVPKVALMDRFGLTEVQADAILEMRLRALNRLQEIELRQEHEALTREREGLITLLEDPKAQRRKLRGQYRQIRKEFGSETSLGRRRTEIAGAPATIAEPVAAAAESEPVTVVLSRLGWIRTVKGSGIDPAALRYREEDGPEHVVEATSQDRLIVVTDRGRSLGLDVSALPGGRGYGEPLRYYAALEESENLLCLVAPGRYDHLHLIGRSGRGLKVAVGDAETRRSGGRQIWTAVSEDPLVQVLPVRDAEDRLVLLAEGERMLVIASNEVPAKRRGQGVRLLGGKADLKSVRRLPPDHEVRALLRGGSERGLRQLDAWEGRRAQAARALPRGVVDVVITPAGSDDEAG